MTEDISSFLRLSVVIVLMAALLSVIMVLAEKSIRLMDDFTNVYVQAANTVDTSVISAINQVPDVSAVTAYKIIQERLGQVNDLRISYLDGNTTGDSNTLLENAEKIVSIIINNSGNGNLSIEVNEVR